MIRAVLIGGAVVGFAIGAKLVARNFRGIDFEKMIERMPEDAPPKWMFRNITAIRENTERILALVDAEHAPGEKVPTAA